MQTHSHDDYEFIIEQFKCAMLAEKRVIDVDGSDCDWHQQCCCCQFATSCFVVGCVGDESDENMQTGAIAAERFSILDPSVWRGLSGPASGATCE